MPPKRILVLAYHVNLSTESGSHHVGDRLEEFAKRGLDFEVVSSVCGPRLGQYKHYRVFSALFADQTRELRAVLQRTRTFGIKGMGLLLWKCLIYPLYLLEKKLLPLQAYWSWSLPAAVLAFWRCRKARPDIIYAVSGAESVHVCALLVSRLTGIPFVAEMLDPLEYQANRKKRLQRRFAMRLEKAVARRARKVVYVTENAAGAARRRHPEHAGKIRFIRPLLKAVSGGDAGPDAPARQDGGRQVMAHFGSLRGSRGIDTLIDALSGCDEAGQWEVRLYGHLGRNTQAEIEDADFGGRGPDIRTFGALPRTALQEPMQASDILILIQHAGKVSAETIPSKAYEYLQTGKLILAYTYDNRELEALLREHGHLAADRRNRRQCAAVTQQALGEWQSLTQNVRPFTETLQQSVDRLLQEMEA